MFKRLKNRQTDGQDKQDRAGSDKTGQIGRQGTDVIDYDLLSGDAALSGRDRLSHHRQPLSCFYKTGQDGYLHSTQV